MNIPERAVEAALRVAIFEDCGDMSVLAAMVPEERAVWEENIRAELEAAAPYLYTQALRDAALDVDRGYSDAYHHGKGDLDRWKKLHEASYWLRDRADELDPHE